jgi:hypothetical protein
MPTVCSLRRVSGILDLTDRVEIVVYTQLRTLTTRRIRDNICPLSPILSARRERRATSVGACPQTRLECQSVRLQSPYRQSCHSSRRRPRSQTPGRPFSTARIVSSPAPNRTALRTRQRPLETARFLGCSFAEKRRFPDRLSLKRKEPSQKAFSRIATC